jgi:hypothetical protein
MQSARIAAVLAVLGKSERTFLGIQPTFDIYKPPLNPQAVSV